MNNSLSELDKLLTLHEKKVTISRGRLGAECSTFRIGGPIALLLEPADSAALVGLLRDLDKSQIESRFLGVGSNLLIPDEGVSGIVLRLRREGFCFLQSLGKGEFWVGAGWSLPKLANRLAKAGFSGFEWAGGIPGSVGGACVMNAGAHGSCLADVLLEVEVVDQEGKVHRLLRDELDMSYRSGGIPTGAAVTGARVRLVSADSEGTRRRLEEFKAYRMRTQPLRLPSAGSVFRNPSAGGDSAGALIEAAGLKEHKLGGVMVSALHGNWIVNPEQTGLASEVRKLIELCQARVREKFEVELEAEVRCW